MNLDDLIPMVVMEAPEVPDPAASLQLLLAARELCAFSLAWQADTTLTMTGATSYNLPTLAMGEMVEPVSVNYALSATSTPVRLEPTTVAQLDSQAPGWTNLTGTPASYLLPTATTIRFVPAPASGTVTLRLAVQPTTAARTIDDRVGQVFNETLVHGALYRLLRMRGRSWSDPNTATFYGQLFDDGKNRAQVRGVDGFTKVARRVRYGGL